MLLDLKMSHTISAKPTSTNCNNSSSFGENIRCSLVGDGHVGKTSMLLSYQADTFPVEYIPTVFDSYSKKVSYNDRKVNLILYDTAGNKELSEFGPQGHIGTDIFLLCFSVDNHESFENILEKWHKEIQNSYMVSSDVPDGCMPPRFKITSSLSEPIIILVGCKSDKRISNPVFKEIRAIGRPSTTPKKDKNLQSQPSIGRPPVSVQQGARLAKDIRAYKYMECCARSGIGVNEIFNEAIKAVLDRREYASIYR